jgi:hypothetical protein
VRNDTERRTTDATVDDLMEHLRAKLVDAVVDAIAEKPSPGTLEVARKLLADHDAEKRWRSEQGAPAGQPQSGLQQTLKRLPFLPRDTIGVGDSGSDVATERAQQMELLMRRADGLEPIPAASVPFQPA